MVGGANECVMVDVVVLMSVWWLIYHAVALERICSILLGMEVSDISNWINSLH